jgi:hypothetical protein
MSSLPGAVTKSTLTSSCELPGLRFAPESCRDLDEILGVAKGEQRAWDGLAADGESYAETFHDEPWIEEAVGGLVRAAGGCWYHLWIEKLTIALYWPMSSPAELRAWCRLQHYLLRLSPRRITHIDPRETIRLALPALYALDPGEVIRLALPILHEPDPPSRAYATKTEALAASLDRQFQRQVEDNELRAACPWDRWLKSVLMWNERPHYHTESPYDSHALRMLVENAWERLRSVRGRERPAEPPKVPSIAAARGALDLVIGWCDRQLAPVDHGNEAPTGRGEMTKDEPKKPARHSPDFRSVCWYETDYSFTENQAGIIRVLWEAWENGTPDVGHRCLLSQAGIDSARVQDVFKNKGQSHPAWGTMVVTSETTKGTCRLHEPSPEKSCKSPR